MRQTRRVWRHAATPLVPHTTPRGAWSSFAALLTSRQQRHQQAVVGALGTSSSSSSTGAARALAAATSAEQQGNGNTTTTTKAAPVGRGWRVLFFGSDEISLATLDLLLRHHLSPPAAPAPAPADAGADALGAPPPPRLLPVGVEALEVVTGVDKVTSARSVPVKQFALRTGLPLHQPPRLKEWAVPRTKDGHAFDIGVVVSFGHFIPPSVLDALPWGAINMHPSLLPRHRGAAPIYHTLLQDDSVTGVTVLEIHRQRFDAGRIFSQTTLPVDPVITYEPLARQLATVGAQKVLETLASYEASLAHSVPQDDRLSTRAPKIDGAMAQVHWERHQPRHVHNLWRALGHSLGVHTYFRSNRLKLVGVVPPYSATSSRREPCPAWPIPESPTWPAAVSPGAAAPGQVEYDARRKLLWIKCAAPSGVPAPEGSAANEDAEAAESRRREEEGWVAVREVQIEGRRVMGAAAFKNGFLAPSHTSRLPPVSFHTTDDPA